MITIAGKQLASSEDKKTRDALDGYMARLQRLQEAKDLSSRIRFVVRDVIDMRKNKWWAPRGAGAGRAARAWGAAAGLPELAGRRLRAAWRAPRCGGSHRLATAAANCPANAIRSPLLRHIPTYTPQPTCFLTHSPAHTHQGAAPRDVHRQEAGRGPRRGGGGAGHGHRRAHRRPAGAARAGAGAAPGRACSVCYATLSAPALASSGWCLGGSALCGWRAGPQPMRPARLALKHFLAAAASSRPALACRRPSSL